MDIRKHANDFAAELCYGGFADPKIPSGKITDVIERAMKMAIDLVREGDSIGLSSDVSDYRELLTDFYKYLGRSSLLRHDDIDVEEVVKFFKVSQ